VQIRGEHQANPVIVLVHGGPGFAMSPFSRTFQTWERDFTIAQWDQRDAGRTYSRNGKLPISLDQVSRDGIEVAEHVHRRLPGAPLILLGHSWGSAVGLTMIRKRPELFAAYVGAGQMSSKSEQEALSYRRVLARLDADQNQQGLDEMHKSGPPPYKDISALLVERKWLAVVDTPAERSLFSRMAPLLIAAPMSVQGIRDYLAAPKIAQAATFADVNNFEAAQLGRNFAIPVIVIEGDADLYTPVEPTARWLSGVQAPAKDLFVLRGGGHDALLTMPDRFLEALRLKVRPLVSVAPPRS
jgi:pimeloyl-ACP methyl ester carboxylesterase